MSEISHYKCDQCGKIETNILYWWICDGDLSFNEGELRFSVRGNQTHWCSKKCLLDWIDAKCEVIDGKMYRGKL